MIGRIFRNLRNGIVAATALAALMGGPGDAFAQKLREINITQATASFAFLPISYAKAAGFYRDEGLDVVQISTRGGGPDLTALISGDVQFNASAGTYLIGALERGRDLVVVYNFYKRNLMGVVISVEAQKKSGVSADAPLKERAAALKGMKLAMSRPGSLSNKQLSHLVRLGGLKKDDVEIVAVGDGSAMFAALKQGLVDGFTVSPPTDRVAVDQGLAVMWVDNPAGDDPSVDPFMMESIITTREYAKANPKVVAALVRATKRAISEIQKKTPAEIFAVIKPEFNRVDPKVAELAIAAVKPALNPQGTVTLEMARNTVAFDGRKKVTAQDLLDAFAGSAAE